MKTLIVYYSHTANNERLANALQRKLGADVLKIERGEEENWIYNIAGPGF